MNEEESRAAGSREQARRPYDPPKLTEYGTVAALTAAGSGDTGESGNQGAKKRQ